MATPAIARSRVFTVGLGAPAGQILEDVAQEEHQADGDDHHGDQSGSASAQWAPQTLVLQVAEQSAAENGQHRGECEREFEGAVEQERDQGAEGDQFAVGEVGQPGRAEDHGESQRSEGDDDAEQESVVDQLGYPVEGARDLPVVCPEREDRRGAAAGLEVDVARVVDSVAQ
jgi:hypothetical protein